MQTMIKNEQQKMDAIRWAHQNALLGEYDKTRQDGEITARTDAVNYGFPENSFRHVSSEVLRDKNPAWRWATRLIPVSSEVAAGAEEILYSRVSYTSEWTLMGSGSSNNIGQSDFQANNIEYKADYFESSFQYTVADIDRLAQAHSTGNVPTAINIVREKTEAVMRGWIQKKNRIFSQGLASRGLFGVLNHPDLLRFTVSTRLGNTNSAVNNLALLNKMESTILDESNGEESADMLVLPIKVLSELSQQIFDTTAAKSVLRQFLENSFTVKEADYAPELKGTGTDGTDVGVMYNRSPEKIQACIPKEITFMPPQQWGNGYYVFCHGKVSGVHVKYPLSAIVMEFPSE